VLGDPRRDRKATDEECSAVEFLERWREERQPFVEELIRRGADGDLETRASEAQHRMPEMLGGLAAAAPVGGEVDVDLSRRGEHKPAVFDAEGSAALIGEVDQDLAGGDTKLQSWPIGLRTSQRGEVLSVETVDDGARGRQVGRQFLGGEFARDDGVTIELVDEVRDEVAKLAVRTQPHLIAGRLRLIAPRFQEGAGIGHDVRVLVALDHPEFD